MDPEAAAGPPGARRLRLPLLCASAGASDSESGGKSIHSAPHLPIAIADSSAELSCVVYKSKRAAASPAAALGRSSNAARAAEPRTQAWQRGAKSRRRCGRRGKQSSRAARASSAQVSPQMWPSW